MNKLLRLAKKPLGRVRLLIERIRSYSNKKAADQYLAKLKSGDYFVQPLPTGRIAQWESPNLVSAILDGKIRAVDDPNWRDFGFKTKKDYAFWSWRLCGLMCVKNVLDAHSLAADQTVANLTEQGVALGGYDISSDNGWFYAPLIKLARRYGLAGQVRASLSIEEIASDILKNHFPIASVHPDVIRGDLTHRPHDDKGHLVLVVGFRYDGEKITGLFINNPSGRVVKTQQRAFVTLEHFREAFAGRGFSLWQAD